MIIHNVEQNTSEWEKLRCGLPTASSINKIITSTGKRSTKIDSFVNQCLAERIMQKKSEGFAGNHWTDRGHELESEAAQAYEFITEKETSKIGFVTDDKMKIGCSPDRVFEKSGLEIKSPSHAVHMKYLIKNEVPPEYWGQVQFTMHVMGCDSWDFMSYHPDLPPLILCVGRDEEYIEKITEGIERFYEMMREKVSVLSERGVIDFDANDL